MKHLLLIFLLMPVLAWGQKDKECTKSFLKVYGKMPLAANMAWFVFNAVADSSFDYEDYTIAADSLWITHFNGRHESYSYYELPDWINRNIIKLVVTYDITLTAEEKLSK